MGTPTFTFSYSTFQALFPALSAISQPVAQMYWNTAGLYTQNAPDFLVTAGTNQQLLYLMTAHLAQLGNKIGAGQASGVTIEATIDKISVGWQQAKLDNQWQYWLSSTEYGKQMLALLQVQSVGGFTVAGGPGRAGFNGCGWW